MSVRMSVAVQEPAEQQLTMGGFGLLRVAGLPVGHWLAGAAPELFALVRQLEHTRTQYAELGERLAASIGTDLVPDAQLPAAHRRWALSLRRKLHNGVPVSAQECDRLAEAVQAQPASPALAGLLAGLAEAGALAIRLDALTRQAEQALTAERERLLGLPWTLLNEDPVGRRAIADGALAPAGDIVRRLARGEPWTSKRLRRRSAYLWRMIARGTVKTTPRTWLCHVALAGVEEYASPLLTLPDLVDRCAVERLANLHVPRRELAMSGQLGPETGVALAPLRRTEDDRIRFWTVDPASAGELRSLTLRRTWALEAIMAVLDGGVRTVATVISAVLGPDAAPEDWEALSGFLGYLATMGVVEPSTPPRGHRAEWQPVTAPVAQLPATDAEADDDEQPYVDVYRRTGGALSGAACQAIEDAIGQVLRIRDIIAADRPAGAPRFLSRLDTGPRPVLDVLGERIAELVAAQSEPAQPDERPARPHQAAHHARPAGGHPSTAWLPPNTPGSAYDRLVAWIDKHADGDSTLRLTPQLLDQLGAPPAELSWPLDGIVRPVASGRSAVLDMLYPAGRLDARFTQAIEALHGPLDHVQAYRRFLAELDERTGVESVELMVPPLRHVAANAVRRPGYTEAWTGDPDLAAYCEPSPGNPRRFLPLTDIAVRRDGDSVVVEAAGRPIRVLYHSMRVAPWPWSLLMDLLVNSSEQRRGNRPRLRCPLVALPHRDFLPRLAVGDLLLLSPAQWRLKSGQLWDPGTASEMDKVRRLARLRDQYGLPRWVVVYSRGHYAKPYPCDLDSLAAIEVVERALNPVAGADDAEHDVFVEEMLPAPGEMPVVDRAGRAGRAGDRSAAEVLLRMPGRMSPAELAAVVARGGDIHIPA